jgi:hypothetical protein
LPPSEGKASRPDLDNPERVFSSGNAKAGEAIMELVREVTKTDPELAEKLYRLYMELQLAGWEKEPRR